MAVFPHSTQALKSSRAWRTYLSAPSLVAHRKTVRSQHGKREEGGGGQLAGCFSIYSLFFHSLTLTEEETEAEGVVLPGVTSIRGQISLGPESPHLNGQGTTPSPAKDEARWEFQSFLGPCMTKSG